MAPSPTTDAPHAGALRTRLLPASAWPEAEATWAAVFAASGSRSFFLSADWVGAWLETFGGTLHAEIVLFDADDGTVGAAVLTTCNGRRAFVPVRQLYFHTAGEPDADNLGVEHTAPLYHPAHADAVHAALGALVQSRTWDEFVLSGVAEAALEPLVRAVPDAEPETEWRPTYIVDLARLRREGARYESALSKNTRDQLKRSLRLYRERGEPTLAFAATLDEARARLGELAALHQQRWKARGAAGAFASERWRAFHERLLARAFPRGAVQLARVSAGDATIGILYNFVQGGAVAFYQSGFRYEDDNRLKPGNVTHALVIQACLDLGLDSYDFLADDPAGSRYKQSLATETQRLAWTVLRRPTARSQTVSVLRRIKRLIRKSRA